MKSSIRLPLVYFFILIIGIFTLFTYFSYPWTVYAIFLGYPRILLGVSMLLILGPILRGLLQGLIRILNKLDYHVNIDFESKFLARISPDWSGYMSHGSLLFGGILVIIYQIFPYHVFKVIFALGLIFLTLGLLLFLQQKKFFQENIDESTQNEWYVQLLQRWKKLKRNNKIGVGILVIILLGSLLSGVLLLKSPTNTASRAFNIGSHFQLQQEGPKFQVNHDSGQKLIDFNIEEDITAAFIHKKSRFHIGSFLLSSTTIEQYTYNKDTRVNIQKSENSIIIRGQLKSTNYKFFRPNSKFVSFTMTLTEVTEDQIKLDISFDTSDWKLNQISFSFDSMISEHIYGMGVQYSNINLKGERVPVWVQEQGHGRGELPLSPLVNAVSYSSGGSEHSTYAPMPKFITSSNRGMLLNNTAYSNFDFTKNDKITVELWDDQFNANFMLENNMTSLLSAMDKLTGSMPELPKWTGNGAIVRAHGGSSAVRDLVSTYQDADVPITGVWIEDWAGVRQVDLGSRLYWNWVPDTSLYPDWSELINELRAQDIKVVIYFNPFLVDASNKEGSDRNLFAEAIENNYFVRQQNGSPYLIEAGGFDAGIIDLTNAQATKWYRQLMVDQLEIGVSGWMADFGEYLPTDSRLASGIDPWKYHNQYPVHWAKLNAEAQNNVGNASEKFFFMRSGFTGSAQYSPLYWLGDQMVNWGEEDGLKSTVKGLINAGFSGLPQMHMDIGGYFSIFNPLYSVTRTPELMIRWMELAAFSAAFRTHEGNRPEANLQVEEDERVLDAFSKNAKLFQILIISTKYSQKLFYDWHSSCRSYGSSLP